MHFTISVHNRWTHWKFVKCNLFPFPLHVRTACLGANEPEGHNCDQVQGGQWWDHSQLQRETGLQDWVGRWKRGFQIILQQIFEIATFWPSNARISQRSSSAWTRSPSIEPISSKGHFSDIEERHLWQTWERFGRQTLQQQGLVGLI